MKAAGWTGLALVSLVMAAVGAGLGFWYAQSQVPQASKAQVATDRTQAQDSEPVAQVKTATIKQGMIVSHLTAYGTVVVVEGKGRIFSLPYESRASKVLAVPGQEVEAGTALLELAPSAPVSLQMAQAKSQQDAARRELALLRQQMGLGLATRQQVLQAESSLQAAELNLKSLEREGASKPSVIRAQSPGLVSRVMVQAGQLVPAGSPLAETIGRADLEVRLGIESDDVGFLQTGQAVLLLPINKASTRHISGRVRLIARQVDPQTRLVSVYVTPDQTDHKLLLHEYMKGRLAMSLQEGLWVPPAAVLTRQDGGYEIFTVEEGRAVRRLVSRGLENPEQFQISGPGITQGQAVIVVGNSQVRDGMAVQAEPAQ